MPMLEEPQIMMMRMAISEIFHTMFFIVADEGSSPLEASELRSAQIQFRPCQSEAFQTLCLAVSGSLIRQMSANLLAKDEIIISEQDQESTLLEMVNMVGGNYLNAADPTGQFKMGIPSLRTQYPSEDPTLTMSLQGEPLLVWLLG